MQQNDEIGPAKGVDVFSIYPSNFALSFLKPFWSTPSQPPHYAGSYTVFLCLSGKGRLELDGRPYCIERGSVWITPSDAPAAWQEYSRPEPSVFQLPFSIHQIVGPFDSGPQAGAFFQSAAHGDTDSAGQVQKLVGVAVRPEQQAEVNAFSGRGMKAASHAAVAVGLPGGKNSGALRGAV